MNIVKQLYALLETRERWQLTGLGLCMLVMALLEMLGVASILPFMQVVSNPGMVEQNRWLSTMYEGLGFSSTQSFLFFLGLMVLVAITVNNGFSAFTSWLIYRYAWSQNHRISTRLLARYLDRPYAFYLSRNTAGLSKNILSEVNTVVQGIMLAALKFMCRVLVALLIIGLLAAVDGRLAVIMGLVLGVSYGTVYVLLRRKQRHLGRERVKQNGRRYQMAGEAFGGIKELKVLGRERAFLKRFREPSWRFCRASASNQVVATLPRYALETIAFSGILLIVLYSLRSSRDVSAMLPVLSLYVFAGYRLMPSLNEMFASAMQIRFNRAALDDLHADLSDPRIESNDLPVATTREQFRLKPLPLKEKIVLRNVSFTYPGAAIQSLESVDLTIYRQQVVGFVGETGAGKTTLIDVILGLLEPTAGAVEVDGRELTGGDRLSWRRSFGYIPQEIFLSDDTIRSNIAFGIPAELIEEEAVRAAAHVAQIDEFISTLPQGYETEVGERGVRLSGGQRQRIGIARALYHDPDVLVMDEATSSLDGATEAAVMEMIHNLGRVKTLILIAHRLSTVRECDVIYLVQDGRVTESGTFDDLSKTNRYFQTMAGLKAPVPESV